MILINSSKYHLVSWHKIFLSKHLGGWGIRQPFWFNVALSIKSSWRALGGKGLWHEIIKSKYMKNLSLELWIRYKPSRFSVGSLFWRNTCKHIHWILNGLAWRIGDGHRMRIGLDPFVGFTDDNYRLPDHMAIALQ